LTRIWVYANEFVDGGTRIEYAAVEESSGKGTPDYCFLKLDELAKSLRRRARFKDIVIIFKNPWDFQPPIRVCRPLTDAERTEFIEIFNKLWLEKE